jgi:hypothetical protein
VIEIIECGIPAVQGAAGIDFRPAVPGDGAGLSSIPARSGCIIEKALGLQFDWNSASRLRRVNYALRPNTTITFHQVK